MAPRGLCLCPKWQFCAGVNLFFLGLEPGQTYALYLYGDSYDGQGAIFTINGVSESTIGSNAAELIQGVNYVVFNGLVPDVNGQISGTWTNNPAAGSLGEYGIFNGAQLVESNPVPEPSTLTLLGIGIAGIAGNRWRRRKLAAA